MSSRSLIIHNTTRNSPTTEAQSLTRSEPHQTTWTVVRDCFLHTALSVTAHHIAARAVEHVFNASPGPTTTCISHSRLGLRHVAPSLGVADARQALYVTNIKLLHYTSPPRRRPATQLLKQGHGPSVLVLPVAAPSRCHEASGVVWWRRDGPLFCFVWLLSWFARRQQLMWTHSCLSRR